MSKIILSFIFKLNFSTFVPENIYDKIPLKFEKNNIVYKYNFFSELSDFIDIHKFEIKISMLFYLYSKINSHLYKPLKKLRSKKIYKIISCINKEDLEKILNNIDDKNKFFFCLNNEKNCFSKNLFLVNNQEIKFNLIHLIKKIQKIKNSNIFTKIFLNYFSINNDIKRKLKELTEIENKILLILKYLV